MRCIRFQTTSGAIRVLLRMYPGGHMFHEREASARVHARRRNDLSKVDYSVEDLSQTSRQVTAFP
jgi:hypothetical protein